MYPTKRGTVSANARPGRAGDLGRDRRCGPADGRRSSVARTRAAGWASWRAVPAGAPQPTGAAEISPGWAAASGVSGAGGGSVGAAGGGSGVGVTSVGAASIDGSTVPGSGGVARVVRLGVPRHRSLGRVVRVPSLMRDILRRRNHVRVTMGAR